MKLYTANVIFPVPKCHDIAVTIRGSYFERSWKMFRFNDPGMVSSCIKLSGNTSEERFIRNGLFYFAGDAMIHCILVPYASPVYFSDGLVTKTNAQDTFLRTVFFDHLL